MNNEQVEAAAVEIANHLEDGIMVNSQLNVLIGKYPAENHDDIRDAFWELYENSCFSERS